MDDIKSQAIIAKLVGKMQERGGWCGETHIQKTAYFLKALMEVPIDPEFIIYKHGPYSFDLHDDLMAMKANRFLKTEARAQYGSSFMLGEFSNSLTRIFPKTLRKYDTHIEFVADELAKKNVGQLERLGTALFITTQGSRKSVDERAKALTDLKPHVPLQAARKAVIDVDAISKRAQKIIAPAGIT